MAVAGGGSVFSAPLDVLGAGRSGIISLASGCRTFHDDADGYTRGEGVGMVVLKRLEEALADKDNILGMISGSARMYSTTSTSITHPSHISQEKMYHEVLGQQALDPEEIVYVDMHGTGTQAGDFEELTSVLNVMGGQRMANNPLVVGAVKAAMGHGEGVASVTALIKTLIKTLMMLRHRTIPSQPGVPFKLNHRFPRLDKRNVHVALHVALENKPLRASPKAADGKIKMLVNTFDASGGNCALVIQEAPDIPRDSEGATSSRQPQDARASHVVALSARSTFSLQRNWDNLLAYLERNPGTRVRDLAYTTTARRMHGTLRKAFVCSSADDLARRLRSQSSLQNVNKPKAPRVVFLFTGQGSQYQSMGMSLYQTSTRFWELVETHQLTASHLGLPEFLPIISGALDIATASPAQVQLAIVSLEIAIAHLLRTWGIVPDLVIGHSLGEYAALCVSGVLSPSDALYLVGRRAMLMEEHLTRETHAMLAIPLASQELEALLDEESQTGRLLSCAVACVNAPRATVASGTVSDMRAMQGTLVSGEGSVRSNLLSVPFAFHSAQVDPVLAEFEAIAGGITFKKPLVPVASTLTGQLVDAHGIFGPNYPARQAREQVNFVEALRAAEAAGFTPSNGLWIEAGPDAVCLGLVRKTLDVDAACLLPALSSHKGNWETLAGVLKAAYEKGLSVDWKAYHSEFLPSLALLSDLPAYVWEYKNYWTPYTTPPAWEVEQAFATAASVGHCSPLINQVQDPANGFVPTMSLQKLVNETLDLAAGTVVAVFSSDVTAQGLKEAVQGHVVNGHAIMPLAVFCDIALTSARHCHSRIVHDSRQNLDCTQIALQDMVITKAVVLEAVPSPAVRTTASYSRATGIVDITFHQADNNMKDGHDLGLLVGKCRVNIATSPKPLTPDQNQTVFLVKTRMQQLRDLAAAGNAHNLLRPVVYRLFGDYVRCGPEYRSMDQVVVSTGAHDALASLTAPLATEFAASCAVSPFVFDGVNQLTGFLLNNSLRCEDDQVLHISEGFGESRQWAPLVPGRRYTTYASGQDVDGTAVDATSYVFEEHAEGGQLVQMTTGIRFQKMKRAVFDYALGVTKPATGPSNDSRHAAAATAAAVAVSRSVNEINVKVASSSIPSARSEPGQDVSMIKQPLAIIAAEVGVSPEDMTDESLFGDCGIDSLMAITVLSTLRSQLHLDLPPTFFVDHEIIGDAKQALLLQVQSQDEGDRWDNNLVDPSTSSASSAGGDDFVNRYTSKSPLDESEDSSLVADGHQEEEDGEEEIKTTAWVPVDAPIETALSPTLHQPEQRLAAASSLTTAAALGQIQERKAHVNCKIIHLQGTVPEQFSSNATPAVILLADETGSSVGYVQLPSLGGPCVYGVDWPSDLDVDQQQLPPDQLLSSLADAVVASLSGSPAAAVPPPPYILGGVQFGAVLAVEVARRLPVGDVAGVLLLDSPSGAEDVVHTKKRLARTRVLRPAQARRIDAAARAVEGYRFEAWSRRMVNPVVLVAEDETRQELWSRWLSGAEVRVVHGAQAGGFLKFPSVSFPLFPSPSLRGGKQT